MRTAILLGVLAGALIAAPFSFSSLWVLEIIGLAVFFHAVRRADTVKQATVIGLVTGVVTMTGLFYWINYTIVVYGNIHFIISALMFSLYTVLFGTKMPFLAVMLFWLKRDARWPTWATFPFVVMAAEMIQFSLFPWYFGSSQSFNHVLLQAADVVGTSGLSIFVAVVAAVAEDACHARRVKPAPLALAIAAVVAFYGYGLVRLRQIETLQAAAPPLRVAAIQPNTPLRWGRRPDIGRQIIRDSAELTEKAALEAGGRLDLVVWPEGGTPFSYLGGENRTSAMGYLDVVFTQTVQNLARQLDTRMLFYDLMFEGDQPYNNVWLLSPEGRPVGSYQKIMLLAFGEYIPGAEIFPWLDGLGGVLQHRRGSEVHNLEELAPQICYEILYPSFTRRFVIQGADYIINVTNDAWFGPTSASWEHLVDALPRAVENRRPMVRATNSGVSVMIDATGRPLTRFTPLFVQDWLVAELRSPDVETFYSRWGDVASWACAGLGLLLLGLSMMRRRAAA